MQMNTSIRKRKRQVAAAGGLQSRQQQICLPGDLTDQLPSCSFLCIESFVQQNYSPSDCASTSNLDHLCQTRSRTGHTIGELSLQCIASDCAGQATNNILLAAYNVCEGVDNALPNTATVINATIQPVSTTSQTTVPPTTPPPATPTLSSPTPAVPTTSATVVMETTSMTVSGSGVSVTVQMMMPTTTIPSQTPSPTEVGSNFMPDEMPSMNTGLSDGAIAGAATGASLAGVLIFMLLFLFIRRRKQAKEDKTVWSKQISSPDTANSQASSFGITPSQPGQNQRRSFWRMSIRPEEIGIAVSGRFGARQSTAASPDMLNQMPSNIPARYMSPRSSWPVPLGPNGPAPPRPPRESVATIFDEDIEQQPHQPPRVSVGGVQFALAEPEKAKRQKSTPQPLELNRARGFSPPLDSIRSPGSSSAIPLTPTYDNGNFVITPTRDVAPNSIAAALASTIPLSTQGQLPLRSPNYAVSHTSPRRNRLQKKNSVKRSPPVPPPVRQDSDSTFFDTDTSPEELDRRLEAPVRNPLGTIPQSPRSPITNLQYPAIPESAAVSPQAREPAQPRYLFDSPTLAFVPKGIRPQRDTMTQTRPPLNHTDSTSSDGLASNFSIEWPVPPSGRPPTQQPAPVSPLARLANRATTESVYSQQRASEYQLSPTSQARITPTKSKSGDLFFKVEM
jgi:hypothetical protein